jgi:hypothetical protein
MLIYLSKKCGVRNSLLAKEYLFSYEFWQQDREYKSRKISTQRRKKIR